MHHIMLDIETLGHGVNSVICQIAAIPFQLDKPTDENTPRFSRRVLPHSCTAYGMQTDLSTILWWMDQSKEAQVNVFKGEAIDIKPALHALIGFLYNNTEPGVQVWANSPSFDCAILRNAFTRVGYSCPWKFWQERDVRTMVSLYPNLNKLHPPPENAHDGIVDCEYQIKLLQLIWSSFEITRKQASLTSKKGSDRETSERSSVCQQEPEKL